MPTVWENRAKGLAHRHRWRDMHQVGATFHGFTIWEYPCKRVRQRCVRGACTAERDVVRHTMGVISWFQDRWYRASSQSGQTMAEYAIVLAIVTAAIIGVLWAAFAFGHSARKERAPHKKHHSAAKKVHYTTGGQSHF